MTWVVLILDQKSFSQFTSESEVKDETINKLNLMICRVIQLKKSKKIKILAT